MKGICSDQSKKVKVLMAAADRNLAEFYKEVLLMKGFEVKVVASFAETMQTLAVDDFDVVLPTNFGLNPGGIRDVVLLIRENYPWVGIVFVSGWFDSAPKLMFGPVDAFFPAPADFEVLASTIRAIVCHIQPS